MNILRTDQIRFGTERFDLDLACHDRLHGLPLPVTHSTDRQRRKQRSEEYNQAKAHRRKNVARFSKLVETRTPLFED